MEKYIKYKRFYFEVNGDDAIQKSLDEVSAGGWDIVYYNEEIANALEMTITIIGGKKQSNILQ